MKRFNVEGNVEVKDEHEAHVNGYNGNKFGYNGHYRHDNKNIRDDFN